jgi:hypothetical protein
MRGIDHQQSGYVQLLGAEGSFSACGAAMTDEILDSISPRFNTKYASAPGHRFRRRSFAVVADALFGA